MRGILYYALLLLLLLLLGLAPAISLHGQEVRLSQSNYMQLLIICDKLSLLSQTLKSDSENLKKDSLLLKVQLQQVQKDLAIASEQLTESQMEATEYRIALTNAQNLLSSSVSAFQTYRQKIETEIASLELQRNIAITVAIIVSVCGIIF